jgi:hypothetical protein
MIFISLAVGSFVIYHKPIIGIFTGIENIKKICFSIVPVISVYTTVDLWNGYLNGVVKAFGA